MKKIDRAIRLLSARSETRKIRFIRLACANRTQGRAIRERFLHFSARSARPNGGPSGLLLSFAQESHIASTIRPPLSRSLWFAKQPSPSLPLAPSPLRSREPNAFLSDLRNPQQPVSLLIHKKSKGQTSKALVSSSFAKPVAILLARRSSDSPISPLPSISAIERQRAIFLAWPVRTKSDSPLRSEAERDKLTIVRDRSAVRAGDPTIFVDSVS